MDPYTGMALGPDTPRVPGYGLSSPNLDPETGRGWKEVHVYLSDGRSVMLKHTCYTEEERLAYNKYKYGPSAGSTATRSSGAQPSVGPQEPRQPNTPYPLKQIEMLEKLIAANLPDLVEAQVEAMAPNLAEKQGEYEAVLMQLDYTKEDAEDQAHKMAVAFFKLSIQEAKDLWVKYAADMEEFRKKKAAFDEAIAKQNAESTQAQAE
jgi:hypothetical protein